MASKEGGVFFPKGFSPYAIWFKEDLPSPFCKQSSIATKAAHNTQSTEIFWFGDCGPVIAWIFFLDLTPEKISVDLVKLMTDFCGEVGALYQVDGHCQGDGVEEHKLTRHGEGVGFPT